MAVVNGNHTTTEVVGEQKKNSVLGVDSKLTRRQPVLLNDGVAPPSPPPTLPSSLSPSPSPSPSGSPLPPSDEEDEKNSDEKDSPHEKADSKSSSESSGFLSSGTNSTDVTTPTTYEVASKSNPDLRTTNGLHPDSYPPLPPIPLSQSSATLPPPPFAARRSKSTGILNYPAGHPRSRACSLPVHAQDDEPVQGHLHSASCSSTSLNVKFAPLPQLAPRKRKSNTPLGVSARGQMMKQRRARMMGTDPDAPSPPQEPVQRRVIVVNGNGMWTDEELDAHAQRVAATEARQRALNSDEYLDEDGEEMEDPFVALGRMVKGAWKKMSKGKKSAGKENEEAQGAANGSGTGNGSVTPNMAAGTPQVQVDIGDSEVSSTSDKQASVDIAPQSPTPESGDGEEATTPGRSSSLRRT